MEIRNATAGDVAAIARIYNEGIEDRVATLETTLRSPEERAAWLANRTPCVTPSWSALTAAT